MSEYVESEAEESEDEMNDAPIGLPQKKHRKMKAVAVDNSDDEEEEDDGEEVKDLIDDNPIEEDSDNESDGCNKRKKSDDEDDEDFDDRLEDEDYDLLEENLGVKVERKKFKRLKLMKDEDSDVEDSQGNGDDRETIATQLFDGSDHEEERPAHREETPGGVYQSDESEGEYSETDDFIVDDEGRPLKEKKRKTKKIFADSTLQEAQDIFGVEFDYDEFEKYDEKYYEDEEDEEEREEQRTIRQAKKQPKNTRKPKSIYEIYEPSELERAGFTDEDNIIRNQDIPERMQTRRVPIKSATEEELEEESEWIYQLEFSRRDDKGSKKIDPIMKLTQTTSTLGNDSNNDNLDGASTAPSKSQVATTVGGDNDWGDEDWEKPADPKPNPPPKAPANDDNWGDDDWEEGKNQTQNEPKKDADLRKPKTISKIRKALDFIRNQHLEVPFIAFYRKEEVQPELTIDDLWKIYRLDARFCQLWTRKGRLSTLFSNMREYQTELIMAKPDEPISDSMRLISDADLESIKAVKTPEELKDMYSQFSIYYSEDVPSMTEAMERKRKKSKPKQREERPISYDEEGNEIETLDPLPDEVSKDLENEEPEEGTDKNEDVTSIKRKVGGGAYSLCRKAGIDGYVKKFGLSTEKFAENLRDNYQLHEVEQYPSDPLELAKDYISRRLPTPGDVLKAAKFMVATQIAREPLVRQSVREIFFERATINVVPTKKGMRDIDEAHPIYRMKYLKEKPVGDLIEDQLLKLKIAQDDKLITMTVGEKIKGITSDNYVEEVKTLYNKDEFSDTVIAWNNLRFECVEFALEKLLYPVLRKELLAKLMEDAREHVLKACSYRLHNWIKVAPYVATFTKDDKEWDSSKGLKVLALAYVPDWTQASFACYIGPDGDPSDYLRLQNIIKMRNSFRETERMEKEADLLALKNFIRQRKPHVCVIGGESREAIMIQEDMKALIDDLRAEDNFPEISVEILDNQLAKIYANSIKAANDFREYPLLLRQAVSLGRRLQDPLIEFAQLCTPDDEILCLRFHMLQDHVPKEELREYLHLVLVNRTNEVGVDVNRAIAYPYTSNLTQFICGLGPRKAVALIKTLKQNNQRLENRTQLITFCHMGPKIFINCSGFIKIDTNSLGDSTEAYVEVLDGSRVHPETYEWARKMAIDALEYDDEDANPAGALEEILEAPDAPERLKDLDLDAFAEELKRQGFGNKNITLYEIREELYHRYVDNRTEYTCPTAEELFKMLTKETPETLYIGKLVTATVTGISHKKPQGAQLDNAVPVRNEETGMWQCAFCMKNDFPDLSEVWNHFDAGGCPGQATGVRIRLDNGISGFIPITKLSDKQVTNPENRVKKFQTIHCRVVKINVDRFSVECTSRTSDLMDLNNELRPAKDPYYDQETEDKLVKKEDDLKKIKHRQTYVKRVIVHPSFKNISYLESEKLMDQMEQGEVIVRPSSKGAAHLTVTWKVAEGVNQHIDVREEGKENAFSLGQSLWIGTDEFEDLDEIIARHVNPMASYARDILNYRYYNSLNGGNKQQAEEFLQEERKKNANKIHYVLHAAKEYPGKFVLSYLPRHKVTHEFITVTPDGFRFRQQGFDSLNQCFKWFKEHYCDPLPTCTPTSTPRAYHAITLYTTTPGYADAISRVAAPPNQFGINGAATTHTTPHYTTPAQAFTPYGAFTSHTPYTPTAQTRHMTPYQNTTPRFPAQQPQVGTSGFLRPGPITPGYNKTPTQGHLQQRTATNTTSNANSTNENLVWRKAAEAWAKSQQKGPNQTAWSIAQSRVGTATVAGQPRVSQGTPQFNTAPAASRGAPNSHATRNAAQVISEGIQKTPQMSSSALNYIAPSSPRSGRESLPSTPRTNFSLRSMVESSLGDETPLYDET